MNFSLSFLSLKYSTNRKPFFSLTGSSSKTVNSFRSSQFKKFFSNFVYSSRTNNDLIFKKSQFSSFLDSPILIDSESIVEQKRFNTFATSDIKLDVVDSVFTDCHSSDDGGSIHLNSECELQCNRSTFVHSESERNGGAISGRVSELVLYANCFSDCKAQTTGQALNIRHQTITKGSIKDTTFVMCCGTEPKVNSESNLIQQGDYSFANNNHSNNRAARGSGALCIQQAGINEFSFCHFFNNSASKILDFSFMMGTLGIKKINLIENEVQKKMSLLSFSCETVVSDSYFQGNVGFLTSRSPGIPHTILFSHCIYDHIEFSISIDIKTSDCSVIGARDYPISCGPSYGGCEEKSVIKAVSGNEIPIIIFALSVILIIIFVVARPNCAAKLCGMLPGRKGKHVRSRPITHNQL